MLRGEKIVPSAEPRARNHWLPSRVAPCGVGSPCPPQGTCLCRECLVWGEQSLPEISPNSSLVNLFKTGQIQGILTSLSPTSVQAGLPPPHLKAAASLCSEWRLISQCDLTTQILNQLNAKPGSGVDGLSADPVPGPPAHPASHVLLPDLLLFCSPPPRPLPPFLLCFEHLCSFQITPGTLCTQHSGALVAFK